MSFPVVRRFPIGAEAHPDGTHFRVWAPAPREVHLVVERDGVSTDLRVEQEPGGYYSAFVAGLTAGARYQYRLDGELHADPASRLQPDGPGGPSQVVDPGRFAWSAPAPSIELPGQVLYELHVGTFTPEGTWRAAAGHLPELARTGVTVIEVMPVAEFPGRFGWGYDGVFPYAPTRLYGLPDDFRAFVDRAHQLGLAVILDVVYNHFGPDGCVFRHYAPQYFAEHDANEWGDGLNFDGPCSAAVREYFSTNAAYWISEFRLDGLRLDATQSIHDLKSPEHVIALIARRARQAAGDRRILLVAENESQRTQLVQPQEHGGYGLDALWNDDFHHSAVVALTGRREAYYTDHGGKPQEFIAAAKYGYLFQGQRYAWQRKGRGTSTRGLAPSVFVNFIENHDQIANSGDGSRLQTRTAPGTYRAMTALALLMPGTPMLFQGQEFGSTAPFLYFADHKPELAAAVERGRAEFVAQFASFATAKAQAVLPVPQDPATFERCKLNRDERRPEQMRLVTDLLALRRAERAFTQQRAGAVDGAVLDAESFALRYATPEAADERLLLVNFGVDLVAPSFPEPLLAPPSGYTGWAVHWSSEDPAYGGLGTPEVVTASGWRIQGHSAIVLEPTDTEQTDAGYRTHGQ